MIVFDLEKDDADEKKHELYPFKYESNQSIIINLIPIYNVKKFS